MLLLVSMIYCLFCTSAALPTTKIVNKVFNYLSISNPLMLSIIMSTSKDVNLTVCRIRSCV